MNQNASLDCSATFHMHEKKLDSYILIGSQKKSALGQTDIITEILNREG